MAIKNEGSTHRPIIWPAVGNKTDAAWQVLFGAGLCMACGQPAVMLFTFGIFLPEIVRDTQWSSVAIASAITPATALFALLSPAIGRMVDRFGARRVAIVGGPFYAAGFAMLGFFPESPGAFAIFLALTSALGFAASPLIYAQFATGWFDRRRGVALSIVFACSSLGIAIWPKIAEHLIEQRGWRQAYIFMGAAAGTIILLSALSFLRDPPQQKVIGTTGKKAVPGIPISEAIRLPIFWKLPLVFSIFTGTLSGIIVSLPTITLLVGGGSTPGANMLALAGVAMLVGRLATGFLLDHLSSIYVTAVSVILGIVGLSILVAIPGVVPLHVAAVMFGLSLGAELNAAAFITSRAFGLRAFASIYGIVTLACGLASAIGPGVVGMSLANAFSLPAIAGVNIGLLVLAVVTLLTIRPKDLPFVRTLEPNVEPVR